MESIQLRFTTLVISVGAVRASNAGFSRGNVAALLAANALFFLPVNLTRPNRREVIVMVKCSGQKAGPARQ